MPLDVRHLLSIVLPTRLHRHHRGTDNKTKLENSEDPAPAVASRDRPGSAPDNAL